ncbi:MAG: UDP-2,3-diacylglucosamine diphosphatase LpxI [Neomegalonema sp.]|nr:UDP-2,3-diacylglucosamine diphosphatase LpxI [Neomegalonema sp.]
MPPKLGIIAGSGALPRLVAQAAAREGRRVHVIPLRGSAEPWVEDWPHTRCGLGQASRLFSALKAEGVEEVCFAGGLSRPSLTALRFDSGAVPLLLRVRKLMRKGDDGLLRGLAQIFEEKGFRLVGADQFLGELLAPSGCFGSYKPNARDREDIARAASIVEALGRVDVGQGAIVACGRCLAVETVGGTDAMLRALAAGGPRGGAPKPSGALYKAAKPGQDMRFDMPAIGPATIPRLREAGLNGVAVRAGQVFILDPQETARAADRHGVFVYGWEPPSDE